MIKIVVACIFLILIALIAFIIIFPIIEVEGESMFPTYHDSEFLLGYRFFPKEKLKVGDVIVYKRPSERICVIKRIARITSSIYNENDLLFYCLGDNSQNSYDSRDYGYIPQKDIVCKIILEQRRNRNES